MSNEKDRDFVTALARGLDVLRCFTINRQELGTTEIARSLGLPQSTVWRLCHTLIELGFLVPSGNDRLRVGAGVLTLGVASIMNAGIASAAQPLMTQIADQFDTSLSLTSRLGNSMVIVQRAEARGMLRLNFTVGIEMSMTSTAVGAAYLAATTDEDRISTFASLKAQNTSKWPEIEKWLEEARKMYEAHGYVLNLRNHHPDLCAVAIPLISSDRRSIMGINCGGPASRVTRKELEGPIVSALFDLAKTLQPIL